MLGPLPKVYRVVVSVCALVAFVGLGAWIGYFLPVVPAVAGTGAGAAVGLLAVMLLLHDFGAHPQAHRVHARGQRHR